MLRFAPCLAVVAVVATVACSSPQSLAPAVNVEGTVEARVRGTVQAIGNSSAAAKPATVSTPAPTPNVQGTVAAAVRATVAPIGTSVAQWQAAARAEAATPTAAPAGAPKPSSDEPITLTGAGIMKTEPFTLRGGNYTITWKASDSGRGSRVGCYHGGSLQSVGGQLLSETIANASVEAGQTTEGRTQAYGLRTGQYFLSMSSGCTWSVTIAPL